MAIKWTGGAKAGQTEYEGRVLREYVHPDSLWEIDRFMVDVYTDPCNGRPLGWFRSIEIGGRPWAMNGGTRAAEVVVDASDEIRERLEQAKELARRNAAEKRAAEEARRVQIGRRVRVTSRRMRNEEFGTEGVVFWLGNDRYRSGRRCGFRDDDGETHWAHETQVEVCDAT